MYDIIVMLEKMGIEIVDREAPGNDYGDNDGHFVAKVDGDYFKVSYTQDSYGGDTRINSVNKVTPKTVQKVEYV